MISPVLRLTAPSRLHFGLLAWGVEAARQFGSVGLMVDRPGLMIAARPADRWGASGPLSVRAGAVIEHVVEQLRRESIQLPPHHLTIESAPDEHVGLGTGTQLCLAVAKILLQIAEETDPSASRLVALTGRGRRSGIGLHGFLKGGLIVDGGRGPQSVFPPLLSRLELPENWSILIAIPSIEPGLSEGREREAFARLPDLPRATTERLCRLVLAGLLPAAIEANLTDFGDALTEIQRVVGRAFAPAQGGTYADPKLEAMIETIRKMGLVGVGQSSWGPCLYGFLTANEPLQSTIVQVLTDTFSIQTGRIFWTNACNAGARIDVVE